MTLIKNPEAFPAWIYQFDDNEEAAELRGRPVLDVFADTGIRTFELPPGQTKVALHRPWTYIYIPVPHEDFTEHRKFLDATAICSVIMDCHFPIMSLEDARTPNDPDGMFTLIEAKETILHNLSLADAITVPRPEWAASLVGINPNVFILPDFHEGADDEEDAERIGEFTFALMEAANASAAYRSKRACTCDECTKKRLEKLVRRG